MNVALYDPATDDGAGSLLHYVADPMCSWCYGFAPVLAEVQARLPADVALRLVLGGLAPDDERPMAPSMRRYVQGAWHSVAARTGVPFEHGFWDENEPRRSTWRACRAVILAGERAPQMFAAIQHAYYRAKRDPSRRATLLELAAELGLEREPFDASLDAPETHGLLDEHLALRDRLGVRAYPSLVLRRAGGLHPVASGWSPAEAVLTSLADGLR